MSTKASKESSKFTRCIKAPIRILTRARDFYIKSMSDCAANVSTYGSVSVIGCPTPQVPSSLPKSFSVGSSATSSNDDDFSELMRVASTRSLGKKIELEAFRQQQSRKQLPMGGIAVVPRSHTVAIGRIDEDKACEFGEDIKLKTDVYPRSRSHAVTNRRVF